MSRVLTFADYIGGSDVIAVEMFPRTKKTYSYNFGQDVSGWTFSADYQSILLDIVTYDRQTGDPNFTDTKVIGYFNNYSTITNPVVVTSAVTGNVDFTIPDLRYTGYMYPNARENVVATVVSLQWDYAGQKDCHRYLVLERWEPSASTTMGNPQDSITPTYTSLVTV